MYRIRNRMLALLVLLALPIMASAYTIVLRDGRRLEVPNNFSVSNSTLTYEVSADIQVTLQLATINIAATEKANGEASGALLKRAANIVGPTPLRPKTSSTRRVVTNADLERYKLAREVSERVYEQRRKELGLPSLEESRQERLKIGERAQTQLLTNRSQGDEAENYWRNRASALRSDLATTNARIGFVQARLNELPLNYGFGGVVSGAPFRVNTMSQSFGVVDQLARGAVLQPNFNRNQFRQPTFSARVGFGNGNIGRVAINPARSGFGRRTFPNRFPFGGAVAFPFDAYDSSMERATLVTELDQLLAQRAGLQARWRELEEEARRSGAYPGWLR